MATGDKYDRTIQAKYETNGVTEEVVADVYRVLDAFEVKSQPRGHAAKKILCAGLRGKGDEFSDVIEAIDALIEDAAILRAKSKAILAPKHRRRLAMLRQAEAMYEIAKTLWKAEGDMQKNAMEALWTIIENIASAGEIETTR